jgi:glycosyltransferase involved in cell wall biosynthesis
MSGRIFIHATNIHQGGGRTLLEALFGLEWPAETVFLLDARMQLPSAFSGQVSSRQVAPSILARFKAEYWLSRQCRPGDLVLCCGNLPPLFNLSAACFVFVQNRFLIEDVPLSGFSWKVRLRLAIERLWLKRCMPHASEYLVQTPCMLRLLEARLQGHRPAHMLPFVKEPGGFAASPVAAAAHPSNPGSFAYVASGDPHKNHLNLLGAWQILAKEGLYPKLYLTLDPEHDARHVAMIDELRQEMRADIVNLGRLTHDDVLALYRKVDALIYPSVFESFGLPLIEARQAGLPVVASELDYVRDILNPAESFDPSSPVSIARAVKRFMAVPEPELPLQDGKAFMEYVFRKVAWQ